jgi:hypothetical protein
MDAALELAPGDDECERKFRTLLRIVFDNRLGENPENPRWTVADAVDFILENLSCEPRYNPQLRLLEWPE